MNPPRTQAGARTSLAVVIGASGGIGRAITRRIAQDGSHAVLALSRSAEPFDADGIAAGPIDLDDEGSIERAAAALAEDGRPLASVIVASGILHGHDGFMPEKSWRQLDATALARYFQSNTIGPALAAKHFLPLLAKDRKAVFAALSARVGSISDNRLGGWHGYRASKAALNMMIRNLAIELGRTHKQAICVGLHPGTVATGLSEPFQRGVAPEKLFSPDHAAERLLGVLDALEPGHSGRCFAWDGAEIQP